jgi:hypothetical protein
MNRIILKKIGIILLLLFSFNFTSFRATWGFFAHKYINKVAVYSLPPEMFGFYKKHITFIEENAVNPDQRRYAIADEAPKHYIDFDTYPDSVKKMLPKMFFKEAEAKFTKDTLMAHGIVPWHIQNTVFSLTKAFQERDTERILKVSADLGHYIADANVPLHTTHNYNGQLTNQLGIHGFWESRLPELFIQDYDLWVSKANYEENVAKRSWNAVLTAHAALDSVLLFEKELTASMGEDKKYSIDERNGITVKVYSKAFSAAYHKKLQNQVNRQMRASIQMIADLWLTAWVNAGQPNLDSFKNPIFDAKAEENEKKSWIQHILNIRKEADN